MASLRDATQPRDTSKMTLLTSPGTAAGLQRPPLPASADPEFSPLALAPIPPVMGTSTDAARQFYRQGVSQLRMPPLPVAAAPAAGAASASQAIQVIAGGGGPSLQVNNIKNPVQDTLNLTGTGVSYGPGPGQVQIAVGAGDGLIHGATIWETDPAVVQFRDDFYWSQAVSSTAGIVGDLNWNWSSPLATANGGGQSNNAPINLGSVAISANTATNSFGWLVPNWMSQTLTNPTTSPLWPLFDYPNWSCSWVFQVARTNPISTVDTAFTGSPVLPKRSLYIGFQTWESNHVSNRTGTNARPFTFVGLRYDRDATAPAISDTTFKFEAVANTIVNSGARNNTQGNVTDTGVTPAEGVWYRLDLLCTAAGQVQMSLSGNGASTGFQTINIPKYSFTGATITFNATTGPTTIGLSTSGVNNLVCAGQGTILNVTSWSGGTAGSSFSRNIVGFNDISPRIAYDSTLGSTTAQTTAVFSFRPPVYPAVIFGNDSEASPAADATLYIDFFSFVWNPGVGGGSGSPDSTKARYF